MRVTSTKIRVLKLQKLFLFMTIAVPIFPIDNANINFGNEC